MAAVQIAGAVAVLAAFLAAQANRTDEDRWPYLLANAAGAAALAASAAATRSWGFLLLEGVWTLVSLAGIVARLRA